MPHAALNNKSPHEVLTGEMPDLGYLQPFGSPAHVFVPEKRRTTKGKLLARSGEGFLVGYGQQRNQYRFWIPSLHGVVISHDLKARVVMPPSEVIAIDTLASDGATSTARLVPASLAETHHRYTNLFESAPPETPSLESATSPSFISPSAPGTFPSSPTESPTLQPATPSASSTHQTCIPSAKNENSEEVIFCKPPPQAELRTHRGREVRPPSRLGEWGELAFLGCADEDEPSLTTGLSSSEAGEWKSAMEKEITSLEKYRTWEATVPPENARFVDTK